MTQTSNPHIRRDHGHTADDCPLYDFLSDGSDDGKPPTPEEFKEVRKSIAGRQRVEELIERSSLGTPASKALRESVSDEAVAKVMARVKELEATECYEDVGHEDDHLAGDRDVNAWFECQGDSKSTH